MMDRIRIKDKKSVSIKWNTMLMLIGVSLGFFLWYDMFNVNLFNREYKELSQKEGKHAFATLVEQHLTRHDTSFILERAGVVPMLSWADVIECMKEHPESVYFIEHTMCARCGSKYLHVNFNSPKCEWQRGCGKKGTLLICPNCPMQISFDKDTKTSNNNITNK